MLFVTRHPGVMEKACPGACHSPRTAIGADTLSQCHLDLILLAFTCRCPKRRQETLVARKEGPRSPGSHHSIGGRQDGSQGKAGSEGHSRAGLGSWGGEGNRGRSKGQGTGSVLLGITQKSSFGEINCKEIIKHAAKGFCPTRDISAPCRRVGNWKCIIAWALGARAELYEPQLHQL